MVDLSGNTAQKYLSLPGGVMVTIRPQQTGASAQTFSLSNIHGDVFATLDATGTVLGSTVAGPFGETITGQTLPVNGATGVSYSYVGKYLKATEAQLTTRAMQMGARVYLPGIGRFTSVDPVQGGTPNPYTYVTDPVNDKDLNGMWGLKFNTKSFFASCILWARPPIVPRGAMPKGGKFSDPLPSSGSRISPEVLRSGTKQWKELRPVKLNKNDIKNLKDRGIDPEKMKKEAGKSQGDLWKDKDGNIYHGPHETPKSKDIKLDPAYENLNGNILA